MHILFLTKKGSLNTNFNLERNALVFFRVKVYIVFAYEDGRSFKLSAFKNVGSVTFLQIQSRVIIYFHFLLSGIAQEAGKDTPR